MTTSVNPREAKKVYCQDCEFFKPITFWRFLLLFGCIGEICLHSNNIIGSYKTPNAFREVPSVGNKKNSCRNFKYKESIEKAWMPKSNWKHIKENKKTPLTK